MKLLFITLCLMVTIGCQLRPKNNTPARSLASSDIVPMNPTKEQVPEHFQLAVDMNRIACHFARTLNATDSLEGAQKKREKIKLELVTLNKHLPDLLSDMKQSPVVGKITNQLYSQQDLFIHDAFMLGSSVKGDNFYTAFNDYIETERAKDSNYDAVNDPSIVKKVNNIAKKKNEYEVSIDDLDISDETKFVLKHFNKMKKIQSPLAEWIVKQPQFSIGPIELFEKATEIYGDPWVAMGVITRLTLNSIEHRGSRKRLSVIASRMKPIYSTPSSDHAGTLYHFWGYLNRVVYEPNDAFRLRTASYGWEMIGQRDQQDFFADHWGIEVGRAIERQWAGKGERPCDAFDKKANTIESVPQVSED